MTPYYIAIGIILLVKLAATFTMRAYNNKKDSLQLSNVKTSEKTIKSITDYSKELNNIHKFNEKYPNIGLN